MSEPELLGGLAGAIVAFVVVVVYHMLRDR
jgi:hypothetical protein